MVNYCSGKWCGSWKSCYLMWTKITTTCTHKSFLLKTSMTVNLLTNVPLDCYEELLTPLNEDDEDIGLENKEAEYDGKNMEAILVLLQFLNRRLDKVCGFHIQNHIQLDLSNPMPVYSVSLVIQRFLFSLDHFLCVFYCIIRHSVYSNTKFSP